MPWNQPGGNNNPEDPWGGKKDQGPPDLDKLFINFINKLRQVFTGKKLPAWSGTPSSSPKQAYGFGAGLLVLVVVTIWFLSGLFIVNPAEEAVVLRFGQYVDVLQPGLHWIARFIDTKYLVDVQKIYAFSLQDDFMTKSSEQGDLPAPLVNVGAAKKSGSDAFVDSVDKSKNLVNVELSVQYRIADPRAYLFNVVNPDQTIQEVSTGALSDVIGQMKLDEVLTIGRESLSAGVMERVKKTLKVYGAGLEVVAVTLRKVQAPDQVRIAFNDVNRADQDRSTYIQHAQAYASRVVPIAQGNAARILADANAYRQQVSLTADADVAKYQALAKVYQAFPEITRERMYLETIQTVLQNTSKILVDVSGGNNVLYLPLDQLMRDHKAITKLETALNPSDSTETTMPASQSNGTGVQP